MKNVDVRFPVGRLSVITGISGSGKSTLMRSVLLPAVQQALESAHDSRKTRAQARSRWRGRHRRHASRVRSRISGPEFLEAVYEVDQSPIGKTSRSTPATYIKVFDEIRNLFAQLPVSRVRGYTREPLFLQHRRRPLRDLQRPGRDQAGDELSAEQLCAV